MSSTPWRPVELRQAERSVVRPIFVEQRTLTAVGKADGCVFVQGSRRNGAHTGIDVVMASLQAASDKELHDVARTAAELFFSPNYHTDDGTSGWLDAYHAWKDACSQLFYEHFGHYNSAHSGRGGHVGRLARGNLAAWDTRDDVDSRE